VTFARDRDPTDFYGSVLWDLAHPLVAWREGLKRVLGLPARTHSSLVAPVWSVAFEDRVSLSGCSI